MRGCIHCLCFWMETIPDAHYKEARDRFGLNTHGFVRMWEGASAGCSTWTRAQRGLWRLFRSLRMTSRSRVVSWSKDLNKQTNKGLGVFTTGGSFPKGMMILSGSLKFCFSVWNLQRNLTGSVCLLWGHCVLVHPPLLFFSFQVNLCSWKFPIYFPFPCCSGARFSSRCQAVCW